MKKLAIILFFLSLPAWATISQVSGGGGVNTACSSGNASCVITVQSTGSGNLIVIDISTSNTSTNAISTVSDGTSTYTHCSACSVADSGAFNVDMAYTLSSASGKTSITVTLASSATGGSAWKAKAVEYSFTSGPMSVDTQGTRAQTTNTTSPAGVALTLTGTNDVIVQIANSTSITAVTTYTTPATFDTANSKALGTAGLMNTLSGTAPTWTTGNAHSVEAAMAFTEAGSAAAIRHRAEIY